MCPVKACREFSIISRYMPNCSEIMNTSSTLENTIAPVVSHVRRG